MGCKRSGYAFLRVGATMRQRARPTLPGRRRTCHGTVSAALQLLLVQQPHWEPVLVGRQGTVAAYGSRTTRASSEPTSGRMACHRIEAGARRRVATAGRDAEVLVVWTP